MAGEMTGEQREVLKKLDGRNGAWTFFGINRSGTQKQYAVARQQLKARGLIEANPEFRRAWRITPAGRLALENRTASDGGRTDG